MFDDNGTKTMCIDGGLIIGKHLDSVDKFMNVFLEEIQKQERQTVGV